MSRMTLQPTGRNILIKRDDTVGKTPGGIIIPDASKEAPKAGVVIGVGPRAFESRHLDAVYQQPNVEFEPGDKVYFKPHAVIDVQVGQEKFILVDVDSIICVVRTVDADA